MHHTLAGYFKEGTLLPTVHKLNKLEDFKDAIKLSYESKDGKQIFEFQTNFFSEIETLHIRISQINKQMYIALKTINICGIMKEKESGKTGMKILF